MKVSNERLLELAKTWSKEDIHLLRQRLGKDETELLQVYKLYQFLPLIKEFLPDMVGEYLKRVTNYQAEEPPDLNMCIESHRIAELRAFKDILKLADSSQ